MPHYKDGRLAVVGDVVRGKGYNVKGPDGQLKEIIGTLVSVTPDSAACNVKVAHVEVTDLGKMESRPDWNFFSPAPGIVLTDRSDGTCVACKVSIEYGQADHFEKIG